jgi:hypothetical protein
LCLFRVDVFLQMGGSEALIDALIRGLKKNGGRLLLRSHVDSIHIENGRAAGVVLQPRTNGNGNGNGKAAAVGRSSGGQPEFIRARKGVISNASVWDTQKLLAPGVGPKEWRRQSITTPAVSIAWQGAVYMQLAMGPDYQLAGHMSCLKTGAWRLVQYACSSSSLTSMHLSTHVLTWLFAVCCLFLAVPVLPAHAPGH